MTSRRSMQTHAERVSRTLQFRPGHVGGRVASAQPVMRRGGTLRTPSVGAAVAIATPAPLLWWKFDEASGGVPTLLSSTDATASFGAIPGSDTFRVAPIAPGSEKAFRSSWDGLGPYATISTGMGGTVVFDFWMDHINGDADWATLYPTGTHARTIWAARLGASTGTDAGFEIGITWAPGGPATLRFYSLAPEGFYGIGWTGTGEVASTTTLTGPMHVVWTTNIATGSSSVSINGSAIGSATVDWGWDAASAWRIILGACETYTDFDELWVYSEAATMSLPVSAMRTYGAADLPDVVGGSSGAEVLSDSSDSSYIEIAGAQEAWLQFASYVVPSGWSVGAGASVSVVARQSGAGVDNELGLALAFDQMNEGSGAAAVGTDNVPGLTATFATYATTVDLFDRITAARLAEGLYQADVFNTGSTLQVAKASLVIELRR